MKITTVTTLLIILFSHTSYSQIFKRDKSPDWGDTAIHINLDTVDISARSLKNYNYSRYKYLIDKVYPLADTAVYLLTEIESTTGSMNKKREQKKYKKELEKELKEKFEDRLKNMSRSEGFVLIELIERNTGRSMYSILKEVKSGNTAFWWNNLGKIYDYDLKDAYIPENNPMLEGLILDYEAKHKKTGDIKM